MNETNNGSEALPHKHEEHEGHGEHGHVHGHVHRHKHCAHGHANHDHADHDHADHDHADHDHANHDHADHSHCDHAHGYCTHDHEHPREVALDGAVYVDRSEQDQSQVVSAGMGLRGDYEKIKPILHAELERMAAAIQEADGVVGHIKAAAETRSMDMFSVTDRTASVKRANTQEIRINLAAIVFLIDPEKLENLVRHSLEALKENAPL
ncbi:MAG: hypothetical protein LBT44_05750 [Clostridiales bacterium]|jgi:hypothetical protein|nr:hypothetical protein [Clostridiales bacterium]